MKKAPERFVDVGLTARKTFPADQDLSVEVKSVSTQFSKCEMYGDENRTQNKADAEGKEHPEDDKDL